MQNCDGRCLVCRSPVPTFANQLAIPCNSFARRCNCLLAFLLNSNIYPSPRLPTPSALILHPTPMNSRSTPNQQKPKPPGPPPPPLPPTSEDFPPIPLEAEIVHPNLSMGVSHPPPLLEVELVFLQLFLRGSRWGEEVSWVPIVRGAIVVGGAVP